jgi:hypothetical protein
VARVHIGTFTDADPLVECPILHDRRRQIFAAKRDLRPYRCPLRRE